MTESEPERLKNKKMFVMDWKKTIKLNKLKWGIKMELKYIVPDKEKTFGAMNFLGHNRDRFQYDRVNNRRTDVLEARVYNLGSSGQGGQIEVTIPGEVELKELDFNEPVELLNPMITSSAQANGNFATVRWTVTADDIVPLKSRSANNGINSVKTHNASSDEKK